MHGVGGQTYNLRSEYVACFIGPSHGL